MWLFIMSISICKLFIEPNELGFVSCLLQYLLNCSSDCLMSLFISATTRLPI